MLKGVGRVYSRQHLQQAIDGVWSLQNHIVGPVRKPFRSRSLSAVVAKWDDTIARVEGSNTPDPIITSTNLSQNVTPSTSSDSSSITKSGKRTQPTSGFAQSRLPSELAQKITMLFSRKHLRDMLTYLRSSTLSEHFLDRTQATKLAEAMVHTSHPQRAIRILFLSQKLGCPLKQNAYECVAHELAEAKHWHLIAPLLALGKRHMGRSTVRLLNWRARAAIESAHFGVLENILEQFEDEKLKPNQRTFHLLVSGHLRNHNLRLARECITKMEAAGFPVSATTHATVVAVYRSLGPAKEVQDHALEALQSLSGRMSTITLNSLMQLYIDASNIPGVLRVLPLFCQGSTLIDDFRGHSIPIDGNGSLGIHIEAPSHQSIQGTIMPDAATFTILINYMAGRRDLTGCLRMTKRMLILGVRPDAATAAALVRSFFLIGKQSTAIRIVADMCEKHSVPRSHFEALGLTKAPHELPFPTWDIPVSPAIFNALMRGSLDTHGLKGAHKVLRIMQTCDVKPDAKTIELFMSHLDQVKMARPRELIHVLRRLTHSNVRPTLNHVHIIMRAVLRREKFLLHGSGWNVPAAKFSPNRKDISLYKETSLSGIADSFDPTAGVEFPRKLSYRSLMRPIVQSLSARHIKSSKATIALRLQHEALAHSDLHNAKIVFQEMLARGMRPTKFHFAALMEGHALSGDVRGAENVMNSASEAGISPNVIMFTILIVGHARRGNPGHAMRVFQSMITAGVRPDVPAIDALASAYFAVGEYRVARRVLLVLWSHVQNLPKGVETASLKRLANVFRARHANREPSDFLPRRLNKSERRLLRWKIARLILVWRARGRRKRDRRL